MSTQLRREKDKIRRRKQIMKAARKLFFKKGFRGTSMDMIASKCQLAKGTLYLYFANKEDLYISLVEDGIQVLGDMMEEALCGVQGVEEQLMTMARTHFRYTVEHKEYHSILTHLTAGDVSEICKKVDSEKLAHMQALERTQFMKAVQFIQAAIDSGEFRADLDPLKSMMMIWMSVSGAILQCNNMGVKKAHMHDLGAACPSPEEFVLDIVRTYIRAFRADTPQ